MEFNIESFPSQLFYLSGIFISFFSSFLIFGKKAKKQADYLLAIWFLIIGLHLICFLLIFSGGYLKFPYILGLEIPLPLIHGPMLYLYIRCLTGKLPGRKIWLLHLAPALGIYLFLLDFFLLPSQEKIDIYQNNGGTYKTLRSIVKILIVLSGILYVFLSSLEIKKYQRKISELYSNTEKINLNWGYYLITGMAMIWIAVILKSDILIFSLVVIFVLLAAYFGISHVGILNTAQINILDKEEDPKANDDPVSVKYRKTSVGNETIQGIYEALVFLMENEKLYKNPELNLNYVAQLLDVHPNILSQTINSVEHKNFYDYINRQRIEEFKTIVVLPENQKFTILTLAFESGFIPRPHSTEILKNMRTARPGNS